MKRWSSLLVVLLVVAGSGCDDEPARVPEIPVAEDIFAPQGSVLPSASEEQKETFRRGEDVASRRFTPEGGLGPLFNVTFCGACHEKPVFGGSAGHYRNFYLYGQSTSDGAFIPGGDRSGVLSAYGLGSSRTRPQPEADANTYSLRNPIPFFGIGLLAEILEESILENSDPDDADGDGISGRPNYDRGFVGRFGTKSQTVSIEGFIRGPIFNHLGITSDPLSNEMRALLPVPSNLDPQDNRLDTNEGALGTARFHQAAAPSEPLFDDDDVEDPELAPEDLFDLVSWAMLLAAPVPDDPSTESQRGSRLFEQSGCTDCHVRALESPRGGIPAYTDLLLHDMGEQLADGIEMGLATGNEFRTAPLWGVGATGPYLHDGRADTLDAAIRFHGGEAEGSRDRYVALSANQQADVITFLVSLGRPENTTEGLVLPGTAIPQVGKTGGPLYPLTEEEEARWLEGRRLFDRDFPIDGGLGPFINGDSCRACHFEPFIGGSGPLGVNAMRYGDLDVDGQFISPPGGTGLAKLGVHGPRPEAPMATILESRQTPMVFGAGLIDLLAPENIIARADPNDTNGDGIAGVAHILPDGRLGRFGWKAQVPSLAEFMRDALSAEMGVTVPSQPGMTFGKTSDDDAVSDPEMSTEDIETMLYFASQMSPPPPRELQPSGERIFVVIGCGDCHVPRILGLQGDVPAYTDLLLHRVRDINPGVADGDADPYQYRTPPLWGLSRTAPYMHDGSASTIEDAIQAHGGEAEASVERYNALSPSEREPVEIFLNNL